MRKILLIDDDRRVRELVSATLDGSDVVLLQAQDGQRGVSLARQEHPDLILLDVNMPVMDGFTACRALKADPTTRGITVIMLTSLGQDADRERGRQAGADDYFTKPFSPLTLLRKIDEVLPPKRAADS